MKRLVVTALLGLALSVAAFASEVEVINSNGTLVGNASGLSLASNLVEISLSAALRGADIGTLTLTTGALSSGNLLAGRTFSFASSSFTISINPGIFAALPQWRHSFYRRIHRSGYLVADFRRTRVLSDSGYTRRELVDWAARGYGIHFTNLFRDT